MMQEIGFECFIGRTYKDLFALWYTSTSGRRTVGSESREYCSFEVSAKGNLFTGTRNEPIILSKYKTERMQRKFLNFPLFFYLIFTRYIFTEIVSRL